MTCFTEVEAEAHVQVEQKDSDLIRKLIRLKAAKSRQTVLDSIKGGQSDFPLPFNLRLSGMLSCSISLQ